MAFRFRKSIRIAPGIRINLGTRGLSATVGPRGASVNVGPRGTYANLGIPGTGLSSRTRLDDGSSTSAHHAQSGPVVAPASVASGRSSRLGWIVALLVGIGIGIAVAGGR